jgi:hypothetical protein
VGRAGVTVAADAALEAGIARIVADAEAALVDGLWPAHPLDDAGDVPWTGLYLGAAGMVWALRALGSDVDVDPLPRFRERTNPEEAGQAGLLLGEAGILLVTRTDDARLAELVAVNERNPAWELLWGSAGTTLAARHAGLDAAWRSSAQALLEEWDAHERGLWTQTLPVDPRPVKYTGPAHGFVGNVHALRGLVDDDELRRRVEAALRPLTVTAPGGLNLPPLVGHEPNRTQWCHGAPGIVAAVGDLLPEDLLLGYAGHAWASGPMEKGPGLCHGTAGNGYALLRTWELTGDAGWLERARGFAAAALEQVEAMRARYGQGRYTLFTGDVGVAVFARACLDGDPRFPILDRL